MSGVGASRFFLFRLLIALAFVVPVALPARAVTVQDVQSPGGITAWLVEDHGLPMVSMEVVFRGGAALDTEDKAGLANFTASLLDEGAGAFDSTAFQSRLDDLASSLGFAADRDTVSVHLRTLSAHVGATFGLLRLALTAPRFDKEPVARVRGQILDALAREKRRPYAIASQLWWKNMFPSHPYGRSVLGTPASVAHITPADMRNFVHARFAKDALIVAVVGDITPAALKPLLDKTFGSLPDRAAPGRVADTVPRRSDAVMVADMRIPQSVVVFGQEGLKRDDRDWYAGLLVLDILSGSGLTSRLALEVREQRGLAYSVSASLDPLAHAAVILGQVASQNARVAQSIALIRGAWRRMRNQGPTAVELEAAKTYLTGSFPLNFDSTGRLARILASMQFEHLGIGYLYRRNALIDGVTPAQAKRVARRILDPDSLFFVVVGSPVNLSGAQRVNLDE